MKKSPYSLTIVTDAVERIISVLTKVHFIQNIQAFYGENADAMVEFYIGSPDKFSNKRFLAVNFKNHAQLRDARQSIDFIRRVTQHYQVNTYPVFVSQYLNRSVRSFCAEQDVGYLDFSGNCRLVFDSVFIEREVPSTQTPERKQLKSLFTPKSSRVLRRLLHEPNRPWKVQTLAKEAQVSLATVSLVKDRLLGDEFAARLGESFIVSKPEQLLLTWATQYNSHQHKQFEFYGRGDLFELEHRFSQWCEQQRIKYAFTMFSGARRVAAFTRGIQRGYAYISNGSDLNKAVDALELKEVNSGGNFRFLLPDDSDIFWNAQVIENELVVSDVQLFLDLASHKGRGEENAEYLLEHRIKPSW